MNVETGKEDYGWGFMNSSDVDKNMLAADFWKDIPGGEICFDDNLDHGLMNNSADISYFNNAYYYHDIRLDTDEILEIMNTRFIYALEEDVENAISSLVVKNDPHVEISAFLRNFDTGIELKVRVSQELSWDPEQNDITLGEIMNGVDTTMQALEGKEEAMRNIVAEKAALYTVDNILEAIRK